MTRARRIGERIGYFVGKVIIVLIGVVLAMLLLRY